MNTNIRLKIAIALYLLLIFIVLFYKPQFIFTDEGELKDFGTGENKTIMPLWIIFALMGIVSYYTTIILFVD
jgi:hypothetical protein